MNLHSLPKIGTKGKKIKGRGAGSGIGTRAGRGGKRHQKGKESIPLHFEGGQNRMVKKFPLLRGKEMNKSVQAKATVITLSSLNRFNDKDEVTYASLLTKGIITTAAKKRIKIVGTGTIEKALIVRVPTSSSAKAKIENAGGTIES